MKKYIVSVASCLFALCMHLVFRIWIILLSTTLRVPVKYLLLL